MLEFLETGKALYVLAAVCFLGLLGRLTARSLYRRLVKETDNMTLTKNRYLRDLKQKTENTFRLNQGITNSRVYLEKQLCTYRFLGLTLSGWGSFGGQMTILCFLLGGAAAFGAYWYRCDSYYIVLYGSVGILAGLVTMVADYWANLPEGKQQLLNALQDYMENSLFNRLVRETAAAAAEESRREAARERGNDRRSRTDRPLRAVAGQGDRTAQANRETQADRIPQTAGQADGGEESQKSAGRAYMGMGNQARKDSEEDEDDFAPQDLESIGRAQRRGGRLERRNQEAETTKEPEGSRKDVDYLKTSLEQIAASRERKRGAGEQVDISPEELELMGQILRQYLS